MSTRADIEQAILDEEATLQSVAQLLEDQTPLVSWSEDQIAALGHALDATADGPEEWKTVTLRRHLFGGAGEVPRIHARPPSAIDVRRAERLRSDLPARVRFRIGTYLARS